MSLHAVLQNDATDNLSLKKHHRSFKTQELIFFLFYVCVRLVTDKLTALVTCITVWESSIYLNNTLCTEQRQVFVPWALLWI